MRTIISLILIAAIVYLGYMLYKNIEEPIAFQEVKEAREEVVTKRLSQIRTSQEIFRSIVGKYASDFDTLSLVLKNDSIPFVNIIGDPDDPSSEYIRTVTYSSAIDSIRALDINLDSLAFVPYGGGAKFNMMADTITYQQTLVHVMEAGTRWKEFMGKYGSKKYMKYDNMYNPDARVKFGDMSKPTLSGNW